jgi:hypothetical protein
MMNMINLSPPASSLIESIRSIGYSFDAAIADIVDNSVSAHAKNIEVNITPPENGSVTVVILDDGDGMSADDLKIAMSLGGKGPSSERALNDLGRFGLGLKTASFSQARKLLVISKKKDGLELHGIEWNLNHVIQSNKWEARLLSTQECKDELSNKGISSFIHGTAVIWNDCDRITQGLQSDKDLSQFINQSIDQLKKKFALIFHKYLDKKKFALKINNEKIIALDPFCLGGGSDFAHSQILFDEEFNVDQTKISIKGYLLPHITRMGGLTRESQVSINGDHTAGQGLYLYRLDRLISSGGWQGVVRKSESNKLARVEVSFGNDADQLWQLDVKKSTALLPLAIRSRIRDLIRGISSMSGDVFVKRVRMRKTNPNSIWERIYDKDKKTISYQIDRNHPIIDGFLEKFDAKERMAEDLLFFIENTFPADLIANDVVVNDLSFKSSGEELESKILDLADVVSTAGLTFDNFRETVISCGLFNSDLQTLESIVMKHKNKFKK